MLLSKSVLDNVKSIVLLTTNTGRVEYVNPFFLELLGYNPNNVIEELSHQVGNAELKSLKRKIGFFTLRNSTEELQFVHTFKNRFGVEKWIQCHLSRIESGQVLLTGSDITSQKKNELSLLKKHKELIGQNKQIVESLDYAKNLQKAILPDLTGKIKNHESMVFYRPKDTVSGDFYWSGENEHGTYVAAIDCTGHGIPGAMLTVMANTMLREVVLNKKITQPAEILDALDQMLSQSFSKGDGKVGANDGFDIGLVRLNGDKLTFAGAFRPLVLIRDGELIEIKGDRYPIGFFFEKKVFHQHEIALDTGDRLYLFSDGYTDQFGGERNKKFTKKKFKDLLLSMNDIPMAEQSGFLSYAFSNWKQQNEQTDDVLVVGVKIG